MSKFRPVRAPSAARSTLAAVSAIDTALKQLGRKTVLTKEVASLGLESYTDTTRAEVERANTRLRKALEELSGEYSTASKEAAEIGALASADPVGALTTDAPLDSGAAFHKDNQSMDRIAVEEYDESQNHNVTTHAFSYNLEASRQDPFGEAFYPTVTVAPDEPGYRVEIELVGIYDSIRRDVSGNPDDWPRHNVLFGLRDPDILRTNTTEVIPVVRPASAAKFVDAAVLAPWSTKQDKETFETSALKFGETINLLSISQTDALLATGASDSFDSLDTAVVLKTVYVNVPNGATNEVYAFNVSALPTSVFVNDQQSNQRNMVVNFLTKDLMIDKNKKTVTGAAPTNLADIVSGGWEVRLGLDVNGRVGLWNGEIRLTQTALQVTKILNAAGEEFLPSEIGAGHAAEDILALFEDATAEGYTVDARRQNWGKRQLGRLVDSQKFAEVFEVPLLSPIATVRPPQNATNEDTASAIARLVQVTNVMASNAAVDALFEYSSTLSSFISLVSRGVEGPALRNVARYLVTPVHKAKVLNVLEFTDSIRSQDRAADIRAGLVNVLRDDVWSAFRDSNLLAARQGVSGQGAGLPTVLLGCDQVLANWLMFDGDLRTLGADFNIKVVSTPNKRMTGKIFVTFVDDTESQSGKPYALGFGNMAWKVQIPLVLQTQRNGQTNRELSVQPSFRHFNNLPILLDYTVTNLSQLVNERLGLVAVTP